MAGEKLCYVNILLKITNYKKIAVFSHPDYLEWQTTIRGGKVQISDKKACIPGNAYFRTSADALKKRGDHVFVS